MRYLYVNNQFYEFSAFQKNEVDGDWHYNIIFSSKKQFKDFAKNFYHPKVPFAYTDERKEFYVIASWNEVLLCIIHRWLGQSCVVACHRIIKKSELQKLNEPELWFKLEVMEASGAYA